ncbi:DUF2795 domain-containing protein [Actinomadura logoneensis]|uniref:DUF2795 domain-containing protein n=1 Tax=Actinomadura logoneensis TaxID=2293572 RepID=A0A372JDY5_9ACTN|nr:DUF2795 domain-containing protein [Actinomadura logoneensis]RFU38221.1 DUF2795 domain-containing protein [Actinomadura logoneensis]
MADQSNKQGPKLDDEIQHETEGMVRGGHPTHAEEWKEPEPASSASTWDPVTDDPVATGGARQEGSPPGMSPDDVEGRSALARALVGVHYPAGRSELLSALRSGDVSEEAVAAAEALPDRSYENLADVAEELGYGRESRRF